MALSASPRIIAQLADDSETLHCHPFSRQIYVTDNIEGERDR
jgi:hypothetical protein